MMNTRMLLFAALNLVLVTTISRSCSASPTASPTPAATAADVTTCKCVHPGWPCVKPDGECTGGGNNNHFDQAKCESMSFSYCNEDGHIVPSVSSSSTTSTTTDQPDGATSSSTTSTTTDQPDGATSTTTDQPDSSVENETTTTADVSKGTTKIPVTNIDGIIKGNSITIASTDGSKTETTTVVATTSTGNSGTRARRATAGSVTVADALENGYARGAIVTTSSDEADVSTPLPAPEFEWIPFRGCCREGRKRPHHYTAKVSIITTGDSTRAQYGSKFYLTTTLAKNKCAEKCARDATCSAYELQKMTMKKGKKTQTFKCETHTATIDSASRQTKSCKKSDCYIKGAQTSLDDTVFKDAIATCLEEDPVGGECVDSPYGLMADWDVGSITDFSGAFKAEENNEGNSYGYEFYNTGRARVGIEFNADITAWNTSAATTFEEMFMGAAAFNQPLNAWDTGASTTFASMFLDAEVFNQPLHEWDTGASTTFEKMFHLDWQCEMQSDYEDEPTYLSECPFAFNQDLNGWNTGAATTFEEMFRGATAFNQPLNAWDTGASTSFYSMFWDAAVFNQPLNEWDTEAATTFEGMFMRATSFNQELNEWDTGAATTFELMFSGTAAFNQPLNEWDTGAVTTFEDMFWGTSGNAVVFNQPLNAWDTAAATSFRSMFYGAAAFNQDLTDWDTTNVKLGYEF